MLKSIPRYRKLHEDIKRDILLGEIPEGSLLPSENELSSKYKITRSTVRQGLQELVKEGFIEKRMGIGSVVVSDRKTLGLLSFKGFSEVLKSSSLSSATLILSPVKTTEWPSPFFYELSEAEKAVNCFSLGRLRTVEKNPVMLEFTYLPQLGLIDFPEKLRQNSLFKVLQVHYKIEVVQVMQDVRAIIGQEDVLGPLQLKTGNPVLEIHRKYITNKDGFHIYSRLYCNTSKYTISNFFN